MKREEGYYWVKKDDEWIIAYWSSPFTSGGDEEWSIHQWLLTFDDEEFNEIDERRITRRDIDAENALHELNPKEEREKMEGLGDKLFGLI